jgi:hypothetical protein
MTSADIRHHSPIVWAGFLRRFDEIFSSVIGGNEKVIALRRFLPLDFEAKSVVFLECLASFGKRTCSSCVAWVLPTLEVMAPLCCGRVWGGGFAAAEPLLPQETQLFDAPPAVDLPAAAAWGSPSSDELPIEALWDQLKCADLPVFELSEVVSLPPSSPNDPHD